ncbi:MAG: hypothetical protein ABIG44_17115 [Planctomycetota bacterium]
MNDYNRMSEYLDSLDDDALEQFFERLHGADILRDGNNIFLQHHIGQINSSVLSNASDPFEQ